MKSYKKLLSFWQDIISAYSTNMKNSNFPYVKLSIEKTGCEKIPQAIYARIYTSKDCKSPKFNTQEEGLYLIGLAHKGCSQAGEKIKISNADAKKLQDEVKNLPFPKTKKEGISLYQQGKWGTVMVVDAMNSVVEALAKIPTIKNIDHGHISPSGKVIIDQSLKRKK